MDWQAPFEPASVYGQAWPMLREHCYDLQVPEQQELPPMMV